MYLIAFQCVQILQSDPSWNYTSISISKKLTNCFWVLIFNKFS